MAYQTLHWAVMNYNLLRTQYAKRLYADPRSACHTHPQPASQVTGLLGLCSQSFRCDCSWSKRSVAVQPKLALSHVICSLDSMFRMIRGTGRRWASVTTVRSTGQICCWANHCVMQALQKACSQWGAWRWGAGRKRGWEDEKKGRNSNSLKG